jgi:HEAT repeat protein
MLKSTLLQLSVIGRFVVLVPLMVASTPEDFPRDSTIADVRAEPAQPIGTPVLLAVTLTNTGHKPLFYVGDRPYPNAAPMVAQIIDAKGNIREIAVINRRGALRSGPLVEIKPTESVEIPALIEALPPGSYSIQIGRGKSARVTVKDDPKLLRKWERELLAKIRSGDPFADFVVYKYLTAKTPSKSLIDDLLQDSLSDDEKVAERAAWPLLHMRELPPNATAITSKAMAKHLAAINQRGSANTLILPSLAGLAATIGSDEALESVLTLAQTPLVRGAAVFALSKFKQEKAVKQLRSFLQDQNAEIRFDAAQALADRKDPDALEMLLPVAHDPKSRWRMYSFDALLNYGDDPRVEPAIKSGLNDPNSSVRSSAEFALRTLRRAKKP